MVDIENAVRYPMDHDDWLVTVLIGGVLSILGFLVVPLLFVAGIVVRAMSRTLDGVDEPPVFEDWTELLVDGLQAVIIWIVYLLIPILIMLFTVGGVVLAGLTGGEGGLAAAIAGAFIGFTISGILALLFGYVATAAVVNFARTGELAAGFQFRYLLDVILTAEYAIPWLVALVVWIVVGFIAGIPVIGWFISPFVSFYGALVAARLIAEGFDEALATQEDALD